MTFDIGVPPAERVYERDSDQWVNHLLRREARAPLARTPRPVRFLALRSAAREAIVKRVGAGRARGGAWIRDLRGVQHAWRKPALVYGAHGEKVRAHPSTGEGHVILTDEAVPRRKVAL